MVTFDRWISVLAWDHLLLVDVAVVVAEGVVGLLTEVGFVAIVIVTVLRISSILLITSSSSSSELIINHHLPIHLFLQHLLVHHWTF